MSRHMTLKTDHTSGQSISPWQRLGNAIVEQAVIDYRKARKHISMCITPEDLQNCDREKATISEVEAFFTSTWFELLTDVDGRFLISRLRKEAA